MPEPPPLPDLSRPSSGLFTPQLYKAVLDQISQVGAVMALSVSSGREERVFYFTRGAILFLATGPGGGPVLEKKALAHGVLPEARLRELGERARNEGTLLQELLANEGGLGKEAVARLVEEVIEEHLIEILLWDGALYDLTPGNPPPKLYEKGVPALRLSTGAKEILDRVRPRAGYAGTALTTLGGSFRNFVGPAKGPIKTSAELEPEEVKLQDLIGNDRKRVRELMARSKEVGLEPLQVIHALAALVNARRLAVEPDVVALTREQDLAAAKEIERALDGFVNHLLANMHLAQIYARVDDHENAAARYRDVASMHFAQERRDEALGALRDVVSQEPRDLEARELIVKVLKSANRIAEAAQEAVELGRVLIMYGLPGRARAAFELSLELVPGSTNVLWLLGGLLGKLGYKDDAVRVFEDLTRRAKSENDPNAAAASSQELLALSPDNATATSVLKTHPGYRRSLVLQYAVVAASLLVFVASVGWGSFEMLSLRAFHSTRESIGALLLEHRFDAARELARAYEASWHLSRHAREAAVLLDWVEREERAVLFHASSREARLARALEDQGKIPEALEHWRRARGASEPTLAKTVEEGFGRCEARIEGATQLLAAARQAVERSMPQEAHDLLARTLERAPWLGTPDLKVPVRIESVPKGALVTLDGQPLEKPTPFVFEHAYGPGILRFEARARDPVVLALDPMPPWPIQVVLPRHPDWRLPDVLLTSAPLLVDDVVIGATRDRSVVAVARRDGTIRWRADLGVFGECDLPLARVDGAIVARLDLGSIVALDRKTGRELWRADAPPVAPDAPDALAGRPVAAPGAVLFREGARGLVLLDARDGTRRWSARLRSDAVGAPTVAGERAYVGLDSGLAPVRLSDGSQLPVLVLPAKAVTSPVALGTGAVAVGVEPDALVLVEGVLVHDPVHVTSAALTGAIASDGERVWVGTTKGEVLSLEAATGAVQRAVAREGRPVRWLRPVDARLTIAGSDDSLHALDGRGEEVWRHPCADGFVAADEARVFVGGRAGLEALER